MGRASTLPDRTGKSGVAPSRREAWSSLACACAVALPGVVLSLAVILGPSHFALHVAYKLAAILFVAGSIGLGFALAASLARRW